MYCVAVKLVYGICIKVIVIGSQLKWVCSVLIVIRVRCVFNPKLHPSCVVLSSNKYVVFVLKVVIILCCSEKWYVLSL